MEIRLRVRYTLRRPGLLHELMGHPGRGIPFSTRTLADEVGCHPSTVHKLLHGKQETVEMELAHALAEAVGVAVLVLFDPPSSPEQNESNPEKDDAA